MTEIDDLIRESGRVVDALSRIKEAVIAQENALAEEQARALKREHYEDESTSFPGEFKENGTFTAADSKKRRGVSGRISVHQEALTKLMPCRKPLRLEGAIAATAQRHQSGGVGLMELVPSATPVVCIMPNLPGKWPSIRMLRFPVPI